MKKIVCVLSALILLMTLCGSLTAFAAASATIITNKSTVAIGETVTVTAKFNGDGKGIGALDAKFYYNADTFEYLSCSGANGSDPATSAGAINISYFAPELTPSSTVTITLTLKAIAVGEGKFKWATNGMYDDEDNLLAAPTQELNVIANNPTLSGNANLKSLVPSYGYLSPKFSPDVTEYTISVDHDVTSMPLSFTTADSGATTSIEGSKKLPESSTKHTRVITVTAPNGTTKKYTVVILRPEPPSTTTTTTTGTTETTPSETDPTETTGTIPPPSDNALEVEVDGQHLTILDTQAPIELPEHFAWSTLTINQVEVPAAVHDETGMTLLYLVAANSQDSGLYIYDAGMDVFTRYRPLTIETGNYLIYDLPDGLLAPAGTVIGNLIIQGHNVSAYMYEDAALSDFCIVWAAPANGAAGWYTYDRAEETLQRHYDAPHKESSPTTQKPIKVTGKPTDSQEVMGKTGFSLTAFLQQPRNVILLGGVGLVAIVIVITVILLIVSLSKQPKGKH